MSDYVNKKGFTVTRISTQAAMETPARNIFDSNGIRAYKSLIPETHTTATRVFFVSGDNGDEFGQFPTDTAALEQARMIAKLSPDERKAYEQ